MCKTANLIFWLRVIIPLGLLCCVVSCANNTQEAEPKLLFEHLTSNARQLYLAQPDGTDLIKVTEFPLDYKWHWLSPDGTKLAIAILGQNMKIIDIPSGEVVSEIEDVGLAMWESIEWKESVAWAPNSKQLVFLRELPDNNGTQVILHDLEKNTSIPLTKDNAVYRSPSWSPDSEYVALTKMVSCGQPPWQCLPKEQMWNVITIDLATLHSQQVTFLQHFDFDGLWQKSLCNLLWSPDGANISFENDCDVYGLNLNKEVFVVDVKNMLHYKLTSFTQTTESVMSHYSTHWLPSGLFVGYSILPFEPLPPEGKEQKGYMFVHQDNLNKGENNGSMLIDSIFNRPYWSPNGQKVATWQGNEQIGYPTITFGDFINGNISEVDFPITLPPGDCTNREIYWSSNEQYIAYSTEKIIMGKDICDPDADYVITVVSLEDTTVTSIGELFRGFNRPIGWVTLP